jgi:hypothetical protein
MLIIKEFVDHKSTRLDNRICILYDNYEQKFFYYGTRNDNNKQSMIDYSGFYCSSNLTSFSTYISYLMDSFLQPVSSELHCLEIFENDYPILSYKTLINKCCKKTLLAAYDRVFMNEFPIGIASQLRMLIHE